MNTESKLRIEEILKENNELRKENNELRKENIELKKEIQELKKLVLHLQEKLNLNSRNSSIPPSGDFKKKVQSLLLRKSLGEEFPDIKAAHLNAFLKRK